MSLIDPMSPTPVQALAAADDCQRALEAIVAIGQAPDPPRLLDQLMSATAALGATASVYTAAIPEEGSDPSCFSLLACHPNFAQVRGSASPPWLDHPWFRFAQCHSTPATDHDVPLTQAGDAQAMDRARCCGFMSALIVPVPAAAALGRVEMLCLGSERADDFEGPHGRFVQALARILAAELHDWLNEYLRRTLCAAAQLSADDLLMLSLEAQGLGTKAISTRTGLSLASVDSRFQRLNRRLNCTTRQASAQRVNAYGVWAPRRPG